MAITSGEVFLLGGDTERVPVRVEGEITFALCELMMAGVVAQDQKQPGIAALTMTSADGMEKLTLECTNQGLIRTPNGVIQVNADELQTLLKQMVDASTPPRNAQ